jgi:4-alpha-glucanotransferase
VSGNHAILGNDEVETAVPLEYADSESWQVRINLPAESVPNTAITYRYIVRQQDGSLLEDWGNGRHVNPAALGSKDVLLIDSWNEPGAVENAFYTEPFREVLLRDRARSFQGAQASTPTHTFKVRAPMLAADQTLCLLGNSGELSMWDTAKPLLLSRSPDDAWLSVTLDLSKAAFPLEYKYGVFNIDQHQFVAYEGGPNRVLAGGPETGQHTIVTDGFAVLPGTSWRGAGVAIPVFSLRSRASFGVGEFTDIKPLVDWCRQLGLKLIQILPINDTTATHTSADSYPYAAISAFALHPLYLNLARVASPTNQALIGRHEAERKRLNGLKDLDYEGVMRLKLQLAEELYRSQKKQTFTSTDYHAFVEANQHWLVPYAAFCYLRDLNGTADCNKWKSHQKCNSQDVAKLTQKGSSTHDQTGFYFFVQYHLHVQLREAAQYAHSQGVILKGDIPIGVYRHGVDAWQEPELYRMDMQAGAPPDAFGIKGQNWSFPTYDWARMKQTGFAWWKNRFEQMGRYFDAFRIDHVLGFFRIWSIPLNAVEGILGHFVPAIPLDAGEFTSRQIAFEPERYLKPYITDGVLSAVFGSATETIKARFLKPGAAGTYQLKPEFDTQRRVEHYFAALAPSEQHSRWQTGLFDLISNVILLPDETRPDRFHFRFSIETTSSFQALDAHTQHELRELYVDYFFRRQDNFWMREAMQKLPALKRGTNMLVCGEDLGMVPACVPEAMKQLGLLTLEVQRMPKRSGQEFSYPKDAPYLSVVTPGTHDMSTVRGWWRENRSVSQKFYNQVLGLSGTAPEDCEPWINRAVVRQHLDAPAMWSVFMLQDLLGMDAQLRRPDPTEERINVPADAKNFWRYRMHLWLEDLFAAKQFNSALRAEIQQAGR